MFKGATLRGIFVGRKQHFEGLLRALEQNRIEPVIDRVFAFNDAPAAYAHLASATHFGKIVVSV
jgi:NADPH:quinone reductase-like Zn-dependent oxidoreductase